MATRTTSVLLSVPQGHDDRLLRTCLAIESAWRAGRSNDIFPESNA